jgi:hypothetical protein
MTGGWESAFAATSALLGEPRSAIEGALGDRVDRAAEVLRALASPSRTVRADAIAANLARVALAIETSRLA